MKRRHRRLAWGLGIVVAVALAAARLFRRKEAPIEVTPVEFPLQARVTGYYPVGPEASEAERRREGGDLDRKVRPLHSIKDFLQGRAPFVSVAADLHAFPVYGEELRIQELERRYGRRIVFRVVDTGGDFVSTGTAALDVRVDSETEADQITGPVHYARLGGSLPLGRDAVAAVA